MSVPVVTLTGVTAVADPRGIPHPRRARFGATRYGPGAALGPHDIAARAASAAPPRRVMHGAACRRSRPLGDPPALFPWSGAALGG